MVVDFRQYTLKTGTVQAFLEMFQQEGLEPQQRILGNFMGLYRTEIGDVNQIIMMFGYADSGERERRRAALYKDPAFAAYLKKARELIVKQEVRLLVAAPCNPRIDGVEA
ncbi:MAG: NIPSNAP family protein [Proteobacteria bacterium]|nr:NIPSNAP family protein [Pseudomonadota bacterium]MDA0981757.1 NIPSNAP family protein [Pseudomonadota bacterium]